MSTNSRKLSWEETLCCDNVRLWRFSHNLIRNSAFRHGSSKPKFGGGFQTEVYLRRYSFIRFTAFDPSCARAVTLRPLHFFSTSIMSVAKQPATVILPLLSTGLGGIIAGGSLYILFGECHARSQVPAEQQLTWWRASFQRGKKLFISGVLTVVPSLCLSAYITEDPSLYKAALPFAAGIPATIFTLGDTNKKLLEMSEENAPPADPTDITNLVSKWARRHAIRVSMFTLGFAMCIVSVSRKHMSQ